MGAFEILDNISGYHEYDISDARNLRFVSDSLCRMTGYSKNELIDSEGGYAGILCEDDRETYLSFCVEWQVEREIIPRNIVSKRRMEILFV